ncbi:cobalt transporter [Paenibacillus sp. 32O-W]|uniref:cation transporter dimerization domain-containing protein n=1 Tax=Paenibacillus sp. 32O-W TaxID=1695218 RepID=UPI000721BC6B|nr:cation transporter dimerization domain-containing protein [Paenibacillus sp. 32O-W]ALS29156.1 cobalt transporter [Paenibacillus sp. 32O-W]
MGNDALIGCLMIAVAFRVGYDNMVGLIGVSAPEDVKAKVAETILADPNVTDIIRLRIMQKGRSYHVECDLELRSGLTLAETGPIRDRIRLRLLADSDVTDVTLGMQEDNGTRDYER